MNLYESGTSIFRNQHPSSTTPVKFTNMTKKFLCASSFILTLALAAHAQTSLPEPTPTPVKVVVTDSMPPVRTIAAPTPKPVRDRIVVGESDEESGPAESAEKPIIVGSAPRGLAEENDVATPT